LRCGCRWATSPTFGRKFAAISAIGRPARSAAGHSQSMVPSVGHVLWSDPMKVKRIYNGVIVFGEDLMELSADPKTPGLFL
jgi:hypothetical protein